MEHLTSTTTGGTITYTVTWGDENGTSGDREPRRPLPPSDPRSAALVPAGPQRRS